VLGKLSVYLQDRFVTNVKTGILLKKTGKIIIIYVVDLGGNISGSIEKNPYRLSTAYSADVLL
jgi:hypothetical protein